jgi:hypothetical protein
MEGKTLEVTDSISVQVSFILDLLSLAMQQISLSLPPE